IPTGLMAHPAPHTSCPPKTFFQYIPSPPSPWGISTSTTPSPTLFTNFPPKTFQFLPPTLKGLRTSAILSSTSQVFLLTFNLIFPPALALLTSPFPTQQHFLSSNTGKLPSPLRGRTMFPLPYSCLHPCCAHQHLPPTGRRPTGTLLKHCLFPCRSPSLLLSLLITNSNPGSTDSSL